MRTRISGTAAALAALIALGTAGVAAGNAAAADSPTSRTFHMNDDPASPDEHEWKEGSYSTRYACVKRGDWGVQNGKWKKYKCVNYPHWEYTELWVRV
ncbi:hypothetical protein [Streptomyces sp. Ac-502]|uniref:hypothetical protein n=1 Tax=Streptomyces sp. Ac-502 TaxID=3342801 RepID=UPI0038627FE1